MTKIGRTTAEQSAAAQELFQPLSSPASTAIVAAFLIVGRQDGDPIKTASLVGECAGIILRSTLATQPTPSVARDGEPILSALIARLRRVGTAARRHACLRLPSPLFEELLRRLLDRNLRINETAEWLATQIPNAPSRSSVERFSTFVFKQIEEIERERSKRGA